MQTRREFVVFLSALSLVGLARPLTADTGAEEAAEAAARAWLKGVDGTRYAASWDEAAPIFRAAVSKAQWRKALESVRAPLGKALSRRVLSRKLVESLPGAPKGPFLVIQLATEFASQKEAVETVTAALGADAGWRVAGYFIK